MIDLHGHMCVGVDDGPAVPEQAKALAIALRAAGVTEFACTSHFRPDKGWYNDAEASAHNHQVLDDLLGDVGPNRIRGAEHYVHEETFGPGFAARVVPYGQSRWLLVETPYGGAPADLRSLLARIRKEGFRVLLAHVERFSYLHKSPKLLDQLQDDGVIFQVNLGSLVGVYGDTNKEAATRLLCAGMVGVLAGDCHDASDVEANIVAGTAEATRLVGADVVHRLTVSAPRAILEDAPPHRVWP
jgi:protein-tyrosine phosphatase